MVKYNPFVEFKRVSLWTVKPGEEFFRAEYGGMSRYKRVNEVLGSVDHIACVYYGSDVTLYLDGLDPVYTCDSSWSEVLS